MGTSNCDERETAAAAATAAAACTSSGGGSGLIFWNGDVSDTMWELSNQAEVGQMRF